MNATAQKVTPIGGAPSASIKPFYLRLAEVQGELERIGKTGVNKDQGYKFVEESAIMDAVKPLLTERGIFMTMKQLAGSQKIEQITYGKNDTRAFRADVDMELQLIDGYDPAVREVYAAHAYALDAGDKALQKALTSAGKYAVLRAFMISTGDDLENDGNPGEGKGSQVKTGSGNAPKATHKQIGFLQQLIAQNALSETDVREIMAHEAGRDVVAHMDLSLEECSKVIESIKAQTYTAYLTRLHPQQPAAKPAVDDTAIVNAEQVKKLRDKFAELRASDADIMLNVSNYSSGGTTDIAKMRVVDATRMFQMLARGEFVPAH